MKRIFIAALLLLSFTACNKRTCYKCYDITYSNSIEVSRVRVENLCIDNDGQQFNGGGLAVANGVSRRCFEK